MDNENQESQSASKRLGVDERLRIGLGGFWTWDGLLLIGVCVLALFWSVDRLLYAMKSEPREISPQEVNLTHNDYVKLKANLEYENEVPCETLGGVAFTLTPVAGSNKRLIVYETGLPVAGIDLKAQRTFTGRLIEGDSDGEWSLESRRIKIIQQFAKKNVGVSENAIVLDSTDKPRFSLWITFLGIVGFCILARFFTRLLRTIPLFLPTRQ